MRPARLEAIHAVLDDIASLVGAPALLEDVNHVVIAYSKHQDAVDPVRASTIMGRRAAPAVACWLRTLGISASRQAVRVPANPELGMQPRVCLPLRTEGYELLGYLWFIDEDMDMSAFDLERARSSALVLVGLLRPAGQSPSLASANVLRDALAGVPVESPGLDRLVDRRLETGGHLRVLAVRATGAHPSARSIRRSLRDFTRALATAAPLAALVDDVGRLAYVDVEDGPDVLRIAQTVSRQQGDSVVIGIGDPVVGIDDLPHSGRTAVHSAACGVIWPDLGPVVEWSRMGLYRLVPQIAAEDSAVGGLVGTMRMVMRNPEHKHLASTAETYLDLAGHAQETARALTLHRTTLYQRLQRFGDVTGVDLKTGEGRTLAHLTLKAARFADAQDSRPRPGFGSPHELPRTPAARPWV